MTAMAGWSSRVVRDAEPTKELAMSQWEQALLITLIVAALVNIFNRRGLLWLCFGAVDYILSSYYYETGLPLHPLVTAMIDASVCVSIFAVCHRWGGHKWELPLFTAFQCSVLVSFVQLFRGPDDYAYALLLELVNWAALIIIISAGTTRLADVVVERMASRPHRWTGLHRAYKNTFAPAHIDAWWWARRRARPA